MIEVRDLYKSYGDVVAVGGISFEVRRGEVVGFLGPNGAGKTTTLRILTGYLRKDRGSVSVAGFEVDAEPLEVKRRIGYLPEDNPLYAYLTVREYLSFLAEVRQLSSVRSAVERAIEIAGLQEVRNRPIGELSKGYRQRVGIAQAILHDPDILILDEPTTGLDPTQIVEIRSLIRELGREKTILLSTHILPEVSATCGRVIIINRGQIVADSTPSELETARSRGRIVFEVDAPREVVEEKLRQTEWAESWSVQPGSDGQVRFFVVPKGNRDVRAEVFRMARDSGWTLYELTRERASLEEVFLQLTMEEPTPQQEVSA